MSEFFEIQATDGRTRAGILHTAHGDVATPCFMPVGTVGAVKALDQQDLTRLRAPIILGNAYHLHLRPSEDVIAKAGGLHKFMSWDGPILTDSGGYQVFSLGLGKPDEEMPGKDSKQGKLVKIDEDGVTFTSHLDGSTHRFTPESAIEVEHKIGADIIMAFDECSPDTDDDGKLRESIDRTHKWAERCLAEHNKNNKFHGYRQYLFGIIQGGRSRAMRQESARTISAMGFDGIAVGGESVGYNPEATAEILDWIGPLLPADKPHYTMGVGLSPADLFYAVSHGADMFDCVAPTRQARHAQLFVRDSAVNFKIDITNAQFTNDDSPVDRWCDCSTCRLYTRQYLRHLFLARELTALRLATIHNVRFMLKLMEEMRAAIVQQKFAEYEAGWKK